jgi:uncharacterized protein (TIGR02145 family)
MKSCPAGWHLPKDAEWDKLYRSADGTSGTESPYTSKTAGKFLKAASGWADKKGTSGNGVDKFGFSALPGGEFSRDRSVKLGEVGSWWSASELNNERAYSRFILNDSEISSSMRDDKVRLISVRCIKD